MQEKIDWYQEVVDLEPSSKLFFPLAKMVAEQDVSRAVETLQRGLDRHPEFIEARLFFVELLHKYRDTEDYRTRLETQLSILSPMLMRYAGFWQAWGSTLAEKDKSTDKGLAISFMGALFENSALSMTEIFSAGLQAVMSKAATVNVSPAQDVSAVQASPSVVEPVQVPPAPEVMSVSAAQAVKSVTKKPKISLKVVSVPAKTVKAEQPAQAISVAAPVVTTMPAPADITDAEHDEHEEQFSLRTRSMAEVLAEQGDYMSAIEIYNELAQHAENEGERNDLQARIASLNHLCETGGPVKDASLASNDLTENKGSKASSPGKERVISVLESLADRLESRVHS